MQSNFHNALTRVIQFVISYKTTSFEKEQSIVKLKKYLRMKWIVLLYSESYSEETKGILVQIYPFSCNQEYYKLIAFQNVYELSIIFQSFLYANISTDSPSYTPTFVCV